MLHLRIEDRSSLVDGFGTHAGFWEHVELFVFVPRSGEHVVLWHVLVQCSSGILLTSGLSSTENEVCN